MNTRFWIAATIAFSLAVSATASAQFQSRWRDQRMPGARPSPYLSLLTPGANRAVVYQGFVRPQLDLQSQIRTQERQIDRFTMSTQQSPATTVRGSSQYQQQGRGSSGSGLLEAGPLDRIRGGQSDLRQIDVGHPVYFQYREQYFPGFRRNTVQ
jgi:hypothetical protein